MYEKIKTKQFNRIHYIHTPHWNFKHEKWMNFNKHPNWILHWKIIRFCRFEIKHFYHSTPWRYLQQHAVASFLDAIAQIFSRRFTVETVKFYSEEFLWSYSHGNVHVQQFFDVNIKSGVHIIYHRFAQRFDSRLSIERDIYHSKILRQHDPLVWI